MSIRRKKIYFEDEEKKPTRYYSTKQEKALASSLSIRRTKNSGATLFDKGDLSSSNCLIECKTKVTPSKQITIHKEWLEKNKAESISMNKDHAILAFNFGEGEPNYFIIDEQTFKQVFHEIENE